MNNVKRSELKKGAYYAGYVGADFSAGRYLGCANGYLCFEDSPFVSCTGKLGQGVWEAIFNDAAWLIEVPEWEGYKTTEKMVLQMVHEALPQ